MISDPFWNGFAWGVLSVFALFILLLVAAIWPRANHGCDADGP